MKDKPIISVFILAVRDRGFLDSAIQSVITQECAYPFEVFLASDGNPSLESFSQKYNIGFECLPQKRNLATNYNNAVRCSRGIYYKNLSDDDYLLPGCLQKLADNLNRTKADAVHANAIFSFLNENGKEVKRKLYRPSYTQPSIKTLLNGNYIHGGAYMGRVDSFLALGGFKKDMETAEEYEFYFRFLLGGYKFSYEDAILYTTCKHSSQKSMQNRLYNGLSRSDYIQTIKDKYK